MKCYSYYDLARMFPPELLLVAEPSRDSRSWDLLLYSVRKVRQVRDLPSFKNMGLRLATWLRLQPFRMDSLSKCLPWAGEGPELTPESQSLIERALRLNQDARGIVSPVLSHNDLKLPALRAYRACRTQDIQGESQRIIYLQDLLIAKGMCQLQAGEIHAGIDTLIQQYELGNLLSAGGDSWFYLGFNSHMGHVCWGLQYVVRTADLSAEQLQRIADALRPAEFESNAVLTAYLGDFFRDVVISLADAGDDFASESECRQWLSAPLFADLANYVWLCDDDEKHSTEWVAPRLDAVARAASLAERPFDAVDTCSRLAELYREFARRFHDDLTTRMVDVLACQDAAATWPEEFQLTCRDGAYVSERLIEQTRDKLAGTHNPLGDWLLVDVARMVDAIISSVRIFPWRQQMDLLALRCLIGIRQYELRHLSQPDSVEELVAAGCLAALPRDRLTGCVLRISDDRRQLLGPSNAAVGRHIHYPDDACELVWEISRAPVAVS